MARFGVHWLTYLVQHVPGRGPAIYYAPGPITVTFQTRCVYACGKRLGGRLRRVLAAFFLASFKATVNAGSQLMPSSYWQRTTMLALYLYLRYYDAAGRHDRLARRDVGDRLRRYLAASWCSSIRGSSSPESGSRAASACATSASSWASSGSA